MREQDAAAGQHQRQRGRLRAAGPPRAPRVAPDAPGRMRKQHERPEHDPIAAFHRRLDGGGVRQSVHVMGGEPAARRQPGGQPGGEQPQACQQGDGRGEGDKPDAAVSDQVGKKGHKKAVHVEMDGSKECNQTSFRARW